jgi:hypothetical protein
MGVAEPDGSKPSNFQLSSFCIFIDSTELTRALETVFNQMNGTDVHESDQLAKIVQIAQKGPDICLILNQIDDSLCVWGIDVSVFQRYLGGLLIGVARRL